jgi:beta-glucanase (GH16 family)
MMRHLRFGVALSIAFVPTTLGARVASAAPPEKPGYALTFDDEFDGSSLDLTKWQRRYKWGEAVINDELEAYVDDAFVVNDGVLSIVGKHEQGTYAGQTLDYTPGVICSIHEQTYGYFESRLRVPKGQGFWPAFWLLGAVGTTGVNEIDIHEILGNDPSTAYMTVHWGQSYSVGHESDGSSFTGSDFSADFHTFGLRWDPDEVVWTIDGVERKTHTGDGVPQVNMYVILNLAIGGGWPGAPDSTTPFPSNYDIDYVRAYQRVADAGVDASSGGAPTTDASADAHSPEASGGAGAANGGASSSASGGTSTSESGGAVNVASGGVTSVGGSTGTVVAAGGSPALDAGAAGVTGRPASSSGCSCRVGASRCDASSIATALAFLALSRVRRRRPARMT